ncbi:hypothetical protein CIHG_09337 [Coccidioides immitis H538.4]|uniref:Uncharacterized protein n=1 Tax=Coccidioides immitis H538.4 TaxID=396776 RepID=A0A0J8UUI8_COCIT|nr:hypothetical protein CIHG_09337 [Coccidioides immitis H538.4]
MATSCRLAVNRSVRRATNNSHHSDATALLHASNRKSVYQSSAGAPASREKMSKERHSRVGPTHTTNQSLFFSPTAGASLHTAATEALATCLLDTMLQAAPRLEEALAWHILAARPSACRPWDPSLKAIRVQDQGPVHRDRLALPPGSPWS